MTRLRALARALVGGGVRCPHCNVPSPHRFPHPASCPWYCILDGGCQHEKHQP